MTSTKVKNVRFNFVLLLTIVLGLFLAIPAEDIPETAFDESETLPYESTSLFSIEIPQAGAPEAEDVRSAAGSTRINRKNATRSPNLRASLALLSILRCLAIPITTVFLSLMIVGHVDMASIGSVDNSGTSTPPKGKRA